MSAPQGNIEADDPNEDWLCATWGRACSAIKCLARFKLSDTIHECPDRSLMCTLCDAKGGTLGTLSCSSGCPNRQPLVCDGGKMKSRASRLVGGSTPYESPLHLTQLDIPKPSHDPDMDWRCADWGRECHADKCMAPFKLSDTIYECWDRRRVACKLCGMAGGMSGNLTCTPECPNRPPVICRGGFGRSMALVPPMAREPYEGPSLLITTLRCCGCGKAGKVFRCMRCKTSFYCSTDCQKGDWSNHKPSCTKWAKEQE